MLNLSDSWLVFRGVPGAKHRTRVKRTQAATTSPPESVDIPEKDEYDGGVPDDDDDGRGLGFESRQNVEVRNVLLRRLDFAQHGFTEGCGGFNCLPRNSKPVGHSAACNTRMA